VLHQAPPAMQNTDGDPFVLTTDDYELLAPYGDVSRRLETLAGVQAPEYHGDETVFVVTKPGNAQHREWENTVVGRIVLTPSRLRAETNSTRRADALRTTLELQLRGAVRFRLRSEANTKSLIEEARASGATSNRPVKEPMPPEAIAAVRAFRQQHMTAWLDDSIPALGGLTPREAARSPRDRPKLEVLLKEFERSEARLPVDEQIDLRPVFDATGPSDSLARQCALRNDYDRTLNPVCFCAARASASSDVTSSAFSRSASATYVASYAEKLRRS